MNILKLVFILLKYFISRTRRYVNLFLLIIKYKPKSILEVGVYRGIRSHEMISVAKIFNKNLFFYGFDLFKKLTKKRKNYELSKFPLSQNEIYFKLSKLSGNINLFPGNTKETLKKFSKKKTKVDFVFIDGGHHINTIMNDWKYCLKISNKKTIFIFDDYYINNISLIKKYGCNKLISSLNKKRFRIKILPFTDFFKIKKKYTGIKMVLIKKK